jgi:hypothetical protein
MSCMDALTQAAALALALVALGVSLAQWMKVELPPPLARRTGYGVMLIGQGAWVSVLA